MVSDEKSNETHGGIETESVEIVQRLIRHRLRQNDIEHMLEMVPSRDRDDFRKKIAGILSKISALIEVSSRLSDTLKLETLLSRIMDTVTEAIGADRGTLFLNDKEANELFSKILVGEMRQEIRFPNHFGIAGSVFRSGKGIIIDDAYADSRFNPEIDRSTGYRTRNILCAPVRAVSRNDQIIGVTQVLNKNGGDFSEEDLQLLEAITAQAASALMNAQLFEQVERARREEEEMLEVTTAISSEIRLRPLLKRIMETTTKLLEADRSTLFVNDEKSDCLWSQVAEGMETTEIRFPNHLGIAGSSFTSGDTINIPDAYADSRFNPEIDKKTGYRTNSILCMPVVNKEGTRIGVTQVLNKRGGPFTATDEKRLRAFSSQVSIALENAKLFEEIERLMNYNESILQSMSNGVLTLNAEGQVVKFNDAYLRIFNARPEELNGRKIEEVFSDGNGWIAQSVEKVIETKENEHHIDIEVAIRDKTPVSANLTVVPLQSVRKDESTIGTMLIFEDITSEKRVKSTMARYMAKEVAEKLLQSGEDMLGGQAHIATVLFSDIRRFTTLTESLGSQQTVSLLNEYFTLMVDEILQEGGILDKYLGDGIMAVFGAPFPSDRDPDKAVRTGIGMLRQLSGMNDNRASDGKMPIAIGVGINTDQIVSGNIGSLKRMDYTVIGDGVNLASRLEGVTKHYQTPLLISQFTRDALNDPYILREVDQIRVKGKTRPISCYEVLDHFDVDSEFGDVDRFLGLFEEALGLYRIRRFREAGRVFGEIRQMRPEDGPARIYQERCQVYLNQPPPGDWDGVWIMTEK